MAQHRLSGPGPGRPKGSKSRATKAKEDYFKVYGKLGGIACLLELLQSDKRSRREFLLRVLPSLMPKNGDSEEIKRIVYDLTPEMESLMRAMIEARRRIDRPSDKRADDIVECQS